MKKTESVQFYFNFFAMFLLPRFYQDFLLSPQSRGCQSAPPHGSRVKSLTAKLLTPFISHFKDWWRQSTKFSLTFTVYSHASLFKRTTQKDTTKIAIPPFPNTLKQGGCGEVSGGYGGGAASSWIHFKQTLTQPHEEAAQRSNEMFSCFYFSYLQLNRRKSQSFTWITDVVMHDKKRVRRLDL